MSTCLLHVGTHARFQMEHVIRTHMGAKHECYNVVFQDDDAEGHTGVRLGKKNQSNGMDQDGDVERC